LQKRIKVWEAVDLWTSLYWKNVTDGELLLEQLGLTDTRNAWFMTLSSGQKSDCSLRHCACADQQSGTGVSR
jgi:ABC-2 type transport system ATP-binding protein